jgi:hypothetical protein
VYAASGWGIPSVRIIHARHAAGSGQDFLGSNNLRRKWIFSPSALTKKRKQDHACPARVCLIRAGARQSIKNREFLEEIRYRNPFSPYRPDE